MSEKSLNYMDTFGISTVNKVCTEIGITLERYNKSRSLLAIHLTQHYRGMSKKERLCMLAVLHDAFNGTYRYIIQELNIDANDKMNYIEKARTGNL